MRRLELGVFLPIGNNGYLMSRSAPQYDPSYELNRRITTVAEQLGYEYAFSMSKWRGFSGDTRFWDVTLESATLMAALGAVTTRIRLIATVSPVLLHPAYAAKAIATADEVSGGRFGVNIVTGASLAEYEQMGVLPPGYDRDRYGYAEEWLSIVKRLWAGERVTSDGRYFHLKDCVSSPRPRQQPHPFLVCAGTSPEGFRFTAHNADYCFLAGNTPADVVSLSARMRAEASAAGRRVKTASPLMVILGATDAMAREEHRRYREAADVKAMANLAATYGSSSRVSAHDRVERSKASAAFAVSVVAGGAERVAEAISVIAAGDGLDSVLLVFPDYVRGLRNFHEKVGPLLSTNGFEVFREAGGPIAKACGAVLEPGAR